MKTLKQIIAGTLVAGGLAAGISGCELYPEEPESRCVNVNPPLASDSQYPFATNNLIFRESYTDRKCFQSGYIGLPGFPLKRGDARNLGNMPGFEFFENHRGGYGDTLEVVSYSNGMYFHWSYASLTHIGLFEGWQGQIEEEKGELTGIRIGSTADEFRARYPNAIEGKTPRPAFGGKSWRVGINQREEYDGEMWADCLTADCDSRGIIKRLRVDDYKLNYFGFYHGPR